jgi:hypothetical protein
MSVLSTLIAGSSGPAISVTIDPNLAYGSRSAKGTAFTYYVTATASGGVAPYTYAWAYVSGDNTFTASAPTAATTRWSASLTQFGQYKESVWKVTVTDSLGTTSIANLFVSVEEVSFE